jgi:proteasome assembly chaperone (PAC2) family protein
MGGDIMTSLYSWDSEIPEGLKEPVLIVALDGWIDAGYGAAAAVGHLKAQIRTNRLVTFDIDELIDQRARRPVMRLVNGVNESLKWPRLQIRHGRDTLGQDILVLTGPEPDFRWHGFVDAILEISARLGVRLCVGFGAFPAPCPHTRPVTLGSTATNEDLAARVGFVDATFEIPAGMQAAIERGFADTGKSAVGIWARVPHYVATMPFPAASAAVLDCLTRLTGLVVDTDELHARGRSANAQIESLVANNPEHQEMVRNLEAQVDAEAAQRSSGSASDSMFTDNLPTGDELAAELEKYLREQ